MPGVNHRHVTTALGWSCLAAVLLSGLAMASPAAGGARLDPSLGAGRGWVRTPIRGVTAVAYAATALRAGRTVVVGQTNTKSGNGQIVVLRYRRNGSLDPSFGARGIFRTAFPRAKGPFIATSVAQTRSGRVLVAGGYGLGSMAVLRLTSSGRLDRSFGRRGLATVPTGGIAQSVAVQPNGGILLGGSNANANGRPMVVARLTSAGALDRRYGRRGLASVLFWQADLAASGGVDGLVPTAGGGVIGFGHLDYIGSDGHGSAGVFRLTAGGRLAPGYGTGGHAEVAFTRPNGRFGQWFPCAITSHGGAVTVTGDGSVSGGAAQLLSTRLSARGQLSRAFGNGGRSIAPGPAGDNFTTCGATSTAGGLTAGVGAALVQLKANGSPNLRFGPGGRVRIGKPRRVAINAVIANGRRSVTVAGSAGNAVYLARYRF